MRNELTMFSFEGRHVRTLQIEGYPWFVLADVCNVLGLTTPARVAERLEEDEKGMRQTHTLFMG